MTTNNILVQREVKRSMAAPSISPLSSNCRAVFSTSHVKHHTETLIECYDVTLQTGTHIPTKIPERQSATMVWVSLRVQASFRAFAFKFVTTGLVFVVAIMSCNYIKGLQLIKYSIHVLITLKDVKICICSQ